MDPNELMQQVRDALTVKRVIGEPYERDGLTVIPAAAIRGGAGGGGGEGKTPDGAGKRLGLRGRVRPHGEARRRVRHRREQGPLATGRRCQSDHPRGPDRRDRPAVGGRERPSAASIAPEVSRGDPEPSVSRYVIHSAHGSGNLGSAGRGRGACAACSRGRRAQSVRSHPLVSRGRDAATAPTLRARRRSRCAGGRRRRPRGDARRRRSHGGTACSEVTCTGLRFRGALATSSTGIDTAWSSRPTSCFPALSCWSLRRLAALALRPFDQRSKSPAPRLACSSSRSARWTCGGSVAGRPLESRGALGHRRRVADRPRTQIAAAGLPARRAGPASRARSRPSRIRSRPKPYSWPKS